MKNVELVSYPSLEKRGRGDLMLNDNAMRKKMSPKDIHRNAYLITENPPFPPFPKEGKSLLLILPFIVMAMLLSADLSAQPASGYGVKGSFSNVPRRILVRQGNLLSADVPDADTNAIPVGDGTYYFRQDLIKGGKYNFIFQAKTKGAWQFEQLPPRGTFPVSVDNPSTPTDKKGGIINVMADNNIRRTITVPSSGSAYYVFCNYGHHPNPPSLETVPQDGSVVLKVRSSGRWGYFEPDVEYGGHFQIYRSQSGGGPYVFVTNIAASGGLVSSFTDHNVVNGNTYYYVATAVDAYGGTNAVIRQGPFDKEVSLPDNNSFVDQQNPDASMYSGYSGELNVMPKQAVKVIFKVENIDWDTVEEHSRIVYLTPLEADGRYYMDKPCARISRVCVR
jgi:hypothetical protein